MEIQHFSHKEGPLRYVEVTKVDDGENNEVVCYGCGKPVLGGPSYGCGVCKRFLHKRCAEMPREITHPWHPQHPLKLSPSGFWNCKVCRRHFDYFNYECSKCRFSVDMVCAWEDRDWQHESHPHPLTLIQQPVSFECGACGETAEDRSYLCSRCGFWIHERCAMLPKTLRIGIGNCTDDEHPLTLAYYLPQKYCDLATGRSVDLPRISEGTCYNCDSCHEILNPSCWVYHCERCRNVFHIRCATTTRSNNDESDEEDCQQGLVQFPLNSSFLELIEQFVKLYTPADEESKRTLMGPMNRYLGLVEQFVKLYTPADKSILTQITNFSHEHPLILADHHHQEEEDVLLLVNNNSSDKAKGEEILLLCDGCILPITPPDPYYSCGGKCSYFLHLACSQLPAHINNHPFHSKHSLSLSNQSTSSHSLVYCSLCRLGTTGFFYECRTCEISIDIKCASLPTVFAHTSHRHPLKYELMVLGICCMGCGVQGNTRDLLVCSKCKFGLCFRCVFHPSVVTHKWDKHPLTLSYPPFSYHPDDIICEICEKDINPKLWMYHCRGCAYSFHPSCIPQLGECLNTKFGGTYKSDNHPHSLTFVRNGMFKCFCAYCGRRAYKSSAFECAPCRYSECYSCFTLTSSTKQVLRDFRIEQLHSRFASYFLKAQ